MSDPLSGVPDRSSADWQIETKTEVSDGAVFSPPDLIASIQSLRDEWRAEAKSKRAEALRLPPDQESDLQLDAVLIDQHASRLDVLLRSLGGNQAPRPDDKSSMTWGDLPESVRPIIGLEPHEWDNKNISEQRDYVVARLAALGGNQEQP